MLRKLPVIIAALLAPALMAAPARAGSFSAIYAFGDSLSDVGNVFNATGEPAPPYANGQFSNGPVWVQDLATIAGLSPLAPSGPPGFSTGGTDYAWGDATTGYSGTDNPAPTVPTGAMQVAQFLNDHNNSAPASGLYTFTLGSNDVFNILNALEGGLDPATAATDLAGAAKTEAQEITSLAGAGAKTFIVALVPDLGLTPAADLANAQGPASLLANQYNIALEGDLSKLAASLDGGLHFLDTYRWLDSAVADPTAVGLPLGANVTDACYNGPFTGGGTVCASPNSYLFWDEKHPTAAVHQLLAEEAWAFVPSPKPGAGLFSLGLLLLIGLKRKRA
jgi:phospholipase/lecithinase/hemolysin